MQGQKSKITANSLTSTPPIQKSACDVLLRFHPEHTLAANPIASTQARSITWPRIFDETAAGRCLSPKPELRLWQTRDALQYKSNRNLLDSRWCFQPRCKAEGYKTPEGRKRNKQNTRKQGKITVRQRCYSAKPPQNASRAAHVLKVKQKPLSQEVVKGELQTDKEFRENILSKETAGGVEKETISEAANKVPKQE